jgi:hypothetical protein
MKGKIMKKNIKLITTALLLGTQTLLGSHPRLANGYFNLFTGAEIEKFNAMLLVLERPEFRYNRFHTLDVFFEMFNRIKGFVEADPERMIVRGLACGILWNGLYVAVNTRRVGSLMNRSKSSINDKFARLGYPVVSVSKKNVFLGLCELPEVELSQWTIRKRIPEAEDAGDGSGVSGSVPLTTSQDVDDTAEDWEFNGYFDGEF